MSEKLAILGGKKTINEEWKISVNRNYFMENDRKAIIDYISNYESIISYYGSEGMQREYEEKLSDYFKMQYCLLFNSGTNAILAAYFSLCLQPGDEVLVPDCSFFAVATPLLLLGVNPVIVDCDKDLGLMDPRDLERRITDKSKAVIVNHLCGHPVDLQKISNICLKHKLCLIEDVSLAFGAKYGDIYVGTVGDITCLSLGSSKLLSGGQGGAFLTKNSEYYERAILFGCFGKRAHQSILNPFYRQFAGGSYGTNSRMHSLAIAMSYSRFSNSERLIEMRHERYNMLSKTLKQTGIIDAPFNKQNIFRGSWHGYYATYKNNKYNVPIEIVVKTLRAEGVDVRHRAHYPMLHELKEFCKKVDGRFGTKENMYHTVLCNEREYVNTVEYNEKVIAFPLFLDEPFELIKSYCNAIEKLAEQFPKLEGIKEYE